MGAVVHFFVLQLPPKKKKPKKKRDTQLSFRGGGFFPAFEEMPQKSLRERGWWLLGV